MQVLGDLIRLPDTPGSLPLPWWHRAPLGLQSKTRCYVSIVPSHCRPVGDVVVSVIDPQNWSRTVAAQCRRPDKPGVVSAAIEAARGTNIALAESVTMEAGAEHEVTLICETSGSDQIAELNKKLQTNGFDINAFRTYPERSPVWQTRAEVEAGWIHQPDWQEQIKRLFSTHEDFDKVDLSMAVVSADTGNRLLRFVFPYKGARTIVVEHRDTPGAMKLVTDVLFDHDLNVLSLLLKRGGAHPGNAILVVVCEPPSGGNDSTIFTQVKQEIEELPAGLMAHATVNSGIDADRSVAPQIPGTVVSRIPRNIRQFVEDENKKIVPGTIPVFFSRRFIDQPRAHALADGIRSALTENGCQVLEAALGRNVKEPELVFSQVTAKMWTAQAGIVLVAGLEEVDALGKNLPYEFGFLQGQTKPILLLIEEGNSHLLRRWSNIEGVYAPRFPKDRKAEDRTHPKSVYRLAADFASRLAS